MRAPLRCPCEPGTCPKTAQQRRKLPSDLPKSVIYSTSKSHAPLAVISNAAIPDPQHAHHQLKVSDFAQTPPVASVVYAMQVKAMRTRSMKWQAILAGALLSVAVTVAASSMASAAVRIVGDPGGEVSSYISKYHQIRASGQRVVIDGPCLSACTLLTGIIPKDRICVTSRAVLGFHAASYDDVLSSPVPTRAGSRRVMSLYPADIRRWIEQHGGLTPQLIELRGGELAALYNTCQ
ncbi:MAG: hypothetical protein ABSC37_01715 [Xanthobacteraceae bacterium]